MAFGISLMAAGTAIMILSCKVAAYPAYLPVAVWVLLGTIAAAGASVRPIWFAFRSNPDWSWVAERVDRAIGDRNTIATALDLARSNCATPMAALAITDGLATLSANSDVVPGLPKQPQFPTRLTLMMLATVGLCVLAWRMPMTVSRQALAESSSENLTLAPLSGGLADESKPIDPADVDSTHAPVGNRTELRTSRTAGIPSTAQPPKTSAAAAGGDASPSSASAAMTMSATNGRQGRATDKPDRPDAVPPPVPPTPRAEKAVAGGNTQADPSSGRNGEGGQGESKPGEPNGPSERQDESGDVSADQSSALSLPSEKAPNATPEVQQTDGKGSTGNNARGPGGHNTDGSGENGQSGQANGQNPPKKARGVAPLLLGSNEADLVRGRVMPGPEKRTPMGIPPLVQPGVPAPDASDVPSAGSEPTTGVFQVTAGQHVVVDAYFQRFHQDTSPAK